MTIHVLSRAYRDISQIWNHIAADNPDAADEQEERFFAAFKMLAEQPGIGHKRQDVRDPRYRFWRVDSYLIANRVEGTQITIRSVVHGARDFRNLF